MLIGGAGEGKQHLSPEGDINNTQEVKSDESLPFYCHPPNPCPKGYTGRHTSYPLFHSYVYQRCSKTILYYINNSVMFKMFFTSSIPSEKTDRLKH